MPKESCTNCKHVRNHILQKVAALPFRGSGDRPQWLRACTFWIHAMFGHQQLLCFDAEEKTIGNFAKEQPNRFLSSQARDQLCEQVDRGKQQRVPSLELQKGSLLNLLSIVWKLVLRFPARKRSEFVLHPQKTRWRMAVQFHDFWSKWKKLSCMGLQTLANETSQGFCK